MLGSVSIPLPGFDLPFSNPLEGELKSDGKVTGKLTIDSGVKIDGVQGSQATIGGVSSSASVKDGKASFSGNVNILKQSYTFKDGEQLSLQASVSVDELLRITVKFTGTDTIPNAFKFDQKVSDELPKGKVEGSVAKEDSDFKTAGILLPGFSKFKGWAQKVTFSVQATIEDGKREGGGTSKTGSLTRVLEWALRPKFGPDIHPPRRFPPPDPDINWVKIPIAQALRYLLFIFQSGYGSQILKRLQQLPKEYLSNLIREISSAISEIQKIAFVAVNDVAKAQEAVQQLTTEETELTQEIEAAETEVQAAETGIETAEAGVEAAEGALAAAESAEGAAAAEVATATAAEAAADASEAADWWTIIGGIVSAGAIAAATAAVIAAIKKHNDTVKKKQQAQANKNQNKAELSKQQLAKKQAETTKAYKSDELKATQEKLKIAKKNKQDKQDVKDILEAAHVGLENMQKQLKGLKAEKN